MNDLFEGVDDILENHASKVEESLKKNLDWTESLKNNISIETDDDKIVISMPLYALFVDKGRSPNSKMPPVQALYGWLEKKNIPKEAAFPIARSIGKEGIPARPFIDESLKIDELIKDIADTIVENIINNIKSKYGDK
jgi:hypothetical protein